MTAADMLLEWAFCKRFAFEFGALTLWPAAAAGFLLERSSASGEDVPAALGMLARVRDGDWWDRVERRLREITHA